MRASTNYFKLFLFNARRRSMNHLRNLTLVICLFNSVTLKGMMSREPFAEEPTAVPTPQVRTINDIPDYCCWLLKSKLLSNKYEMEILETINTIARLQRETDHVIACLQAAKDRMASPHKVKDLSELIPDEIRLAYHKVIQCIRSDWTQSSRKNNHEWFIFDSHSDKGNDLILRLASKFNLSLSIQSEEFMEAIPLSGGYDTACYIPCSSIWIKQSDFAKVQAFFQFNLRDANGQPFVLPTSGSSPN